MFFAPFGIRAPKIGIGLGIIRLELDCFGISGGGSWNLAQRFENGSEIVVGLGAGAALNRFGNELSGVVVVTGLMRQNSQEMQRIHLIRIGDEELAINRLGIGESPGAVMLERGFN